MKLVVRKVASSLHPIGDESWQSFDKLKRDRDYVVTVRLTRNAEFLSRYWSVLSVAVDHCDAWDDREDVDHWVRVQIPWMREEYVVEEDGTIVVRLKSIAADEMDEETFERFYTRAMELISAKIGTDIESLAAEAWNRSKRHAVPNV